MTQLADEVWEGWWNHELCREGVQVGTHKYEEYKGVCFYNGDFTLVVDMSLHRVDEDDSEAGLTFQEWDPSVDTDDSQTPVSMIVNSRQLRSIDFDLRKVIPLQLEAVSLGRPAYACTTLSTYVSHHKTHVKM